MICFEEFRVQVVKRDPSINLAHYVRSYAVRPGVSCTRAGDGGVARVVVGAADGVAGF